MCAIATSRAKSGRWGHSGRSRWLVRARGWLSAKGVVRNVFSINEGGNLHNYATTHLQSPRLPPGLKVRKRMRADNLHNCAITDIKSEILIMGAASTRTPRSPAIKSRGWLVERQTRNSAYFEFYDTRRVSSRRRKSLFDLTYLAALKSITRITRRRSRPKLEKMCAKFVSLDYRYYLNFISS